MAQEWTYRVGIMGCPSQPEDIWSAENLRRLRELGFNAMQLNIAWGARPADEPLNLEDVVDLPPELAEELAQSVPLRSDPSPEAVARRRNGLKARIALCREAGMRTIFHFGAPYNGELGYTGQPLANCVLDGVTDRRYVALLHAFAEAYPGVDDILVYTFDQDAWLCDEFGPCERCRGIPLHRRAADFVNLLAATWRELSPGGRLWWEPWELSGGQVLHAMERLDPATVGMSLHSNIAEVMATLPVDRWLKNAASLALGRGMSLIVEHWLGAPSEELETYRYLQHPLVTWRALQAIAAVPGVEGIKEYYGLLPNKEDPNLRMTGLFFDDPLLSEESALRRLAEPYGDAADNVIRFWRVSSRAMELFPWETSWFIREVGRCDVVHAMSAAFIRGQQCHTPSWDSTRRAIFMKTDDEQPEAAMLEDVQLRCDLAARHMAEALELGRELVTQLPDGLREPFAKGLEELDGFRRRALSYVYHLRETNLAMLLRAYRAEGRAAPDRITAELIQVLEADRANQGTDEPLGAALALLQEDMDRFLSTYFTVTENTRSKGYFSVTSR